MEKKINIGFLICCRIISHILPLINIFSKNSIFNVVIFIEKDCSDFKNYIDINNTKLISKKEFEELKNYYIFKSSPYAINSSIDSDKLFKNNKVLCINYGFYMHLKLYPIVYNHFEYKKFYATFHECQENYDDYLNYMNSKIYNFDEKTAHLSGSTKIDYLNIQNNILLKEDKRNILFSFRWEKISNTNTQDVFNNYFIDLINKNDLNLIFRPHPCDKNNELNKIKNMNFMIDNDWDYTNSFNKSSIFISDLSSLIAEYLIYTKKPIILLKNKNFTFSDSLNTFGLKILPALYIVENSNELDDILSKLLNNFDPKKEIREKLANELNIYNATKYIKDFIINDSK